MTRINCVPVWELSVKHLVAEYRELPRVYALAFSAHARGEHPSAHPSEYVLGTGHVRFFYSRLGYVRARHKALIKEMLARGYKPTFRTTPNLAALPRGWKRHWTPCEAAMGANRVRLQLRGG